MDNKDNITISKQKLITILASMGTAFIAIIAVMLYVVLDDGNTAANQGPTERIKPGQQQVDPKATAPSDQSATDPTPNQGQTQAPQDQNQPVQGQDQSPQGQTQAPQNQTQAPQNQTQPTQGQTQPTGSTTAPVPSTKGSSGIISAERAKQIALRDAGLTENQVIVSKLKHEWDDGVQKYEVEFYYNNVEYEYDIDATTGAIIEKDIDD